ncbi:glycosyltransferase [Glycomyces niveus]|uniref:Glycosyltransferase n=1 Tax=Glycomyces niveus TaxID=2820287 RepID=A0ABS3U910_9ACTN|nr:glycosyltransferase [Glycomyces sp. NEAU-S30]MBO3735265.1 glycosyltransferase [Glycomyces sp. NEAU-S30]
MPPIDDPSDRDAVLRSNLRQLRRGRISNRAVVASVLRSGSREARHLLAFRAVNPHLPLEAIADAAADPAALNGHKIDVNWMAALARVHLLGNTSREDQLLGLRLFDLLLEHHPEHKIAKRDKEIHLQATGALGSRERAVELLERYADVHPEIAYAVRADLANPWTARGSEAAWLPGFDALFPAPAIRFTDDPAKAPFDRIAVDPLPAVDAAETIAVMVTCFKPDETILTAITSILGQTWRNLEVLLVDDGSGDEYSGLLERCAGLDPRVKVIRSPENRGTYHCRNLALDATDAPFVTTHDSDDWMHPRRLELQVAPLLADDALVGTGSDCVFTTDRLELNRVGRLHRSLCTAALLYRRERVLARLGYMDAVRKAADTEYFRRMVAAFGAAAFTHLEQNLTLVRTRSDSLSGGDFRAGWIHPARAVYRSSYEAWHRSIAAGDASPYLPRGERGPFYAPRQFRLAPPEPESYDVVFAADLTSTGTPRISFLNDLRACVSAGLKAGVMHLPTLRFADIRRQPLLGPVQDLLNAGRIAHVTLEDQVDIGLLVVRNPSAVQYPPDTVCKARISRVVLLAGSSPAAPFGELRYDPSTCEAFAERLFGRTPTWFCRNDAVQGALRFLGATSDRIAAEILPEVVLSAGPPRSGFRAALPVMGRFDFTEGHRSWPSDPAALADAYPSDLGVDVRFMGSLTVPLERLGRTRLPANWTRFGLDPAEVRSFLHQIDFFACFPQEDVASIPPAEVLEALAAGCVVLMPPRLRDAFGEGPVYCEPSEVLDVIAEFHADPQRFAEYSRKIQQATFERHGPADFAATLRRLARVLIPAH